MRSHTDAMGSTLQRSWSEVASDPVPGAWREHPRLAACELVSDVASNARRGDDAVLTALLLLVRAGDPLAGIVILWALWPRVRRSADIAGIREVNSVAAPLWLGLTQYPLARRPRRIAANLVLDALKAVRGERREQPVAPDVLAGGWGQSLHPVDETPTGDVAIARAVALGLITDQSARVLRSVYLDAMPGKVAAVRHATSETAIRWRCSASVRRMSTHAAQLVA